MKKSIAFYTGACFLLSVGIVLALWGLSEDFRDKPGSFLRQYPPHPVIESKRLLLDDDHYYFAGATSGEIYLANWVKPFELLKVTSSLTDTMRVRLKIDGLDGTPFVRILVAIDSPYFYLMDGSIPYMYRGLIGEWIGTEFMKEPGYFIDAIPISSSTFAVRALSAKTRGYALGKMHVNTDHPVRLNLDLLERQFDGVFDVDGTLSYDRKANQLVYTYFYRNQYIVVDTNMQLHYRANTIDTFKIAQIKVSQLHSDNSRHLASPPYTINKSHARYMDWLFIHSLVPAKNDDMERFKRASVVDVYDLRSRKYHLSFHVYGDGNQSIKDMLATDGHLFVLFDGSIRNLRMTSYFFKDTIRIARNENAENL